jgi:hypothetical protein
VKSIKMNAKELEAMETERKDLVEQGKILLKNSTSILRWRMGTILFCMVFACKDLAYPNPSHITSDHIFGIIQLVIMVVMGMLVGKALKDRQRIQSELLALELIGSFLEIVPVLGARVSVKLASCEADRSEGDKMENMLN